MMSWPKSKKVQAAISFALAAWSATGVFVQFAMRSFNDFYFAPHKAYPYPYQTEAAARIALGLKCGMTFLVVFAILYFAQRGLAANRRNADTN